MGKFLVVEGLDLSGKSSVIIPYLQSKLEDKNVVFFSDMKTGKISEKIRDIFMDTECVNENTDWRTIAYLASTARSDLVKQYIEPALKSGKHVICDRYVDTSFVYNLQSDISPINTILNLSTHLIYPDAVLFAYCSYEEMIFRKESRSKVDQWDIVSKEEYDKKLERYREQLYSKSTKIIELDTSGTIEEVHRKLDKFIELF